MGEPMDRSNRVFAPLSSFSVAFPTVEKAWFEYKELSVTGYGEMNVYLISSSGGLMRCSNPQCQQGGYELDLQMHWMVPEKQTEREVSLHCHGHEGSPKGRRRGASCYRSVKGILKIKYKDENPAT